MAELVSKLIINFCVAFGVVLGGAMLGGVAAVLTLQPPTAQMTTLAEKMKIWAVVASVGGSIDPIRYIETQFAEGQISLATQQILFIISAFTGAQLGNSLIQMICKGGTAP
ncbi:sporulation protein [Gordoniibacillus kamchatkensis]|uniref:Sporulation protein n=1 Tax=Gordoniibacillus kamchatkensis TaxID=1590651 RepID=A0ABR5APS5_9BACL|nr:YtrH family sporulation protein [Paenibacillus sp. VKM B-2647]KIL42372.1 sporulation protein [Paenibacillus sp. VKM B-2647]